MTKEDALETWLPVVEMAIVDANIPEAKEALEMAFKALEQEPKMLSEIDHLHKYISKLETQIVEQEPCDNCISRQVALDAFGLSEITRKYGGDHSGYDTVMKYEIQDILEGLPPVTPQPKMGCEGCIYEKTRTNSAYPCSHCGRCYTDKYKAEQKGRNDGTDQQRSCQTDH